MSLKKAIDKLKFDSRMTEINIKNQVLTRDDVKKANEGLDDVKANAIPLDLDTDIDDSSMN